MSLKNERLSQASRPESGESNEWEALRVGFDGSIKLEFHGAKVTSDAGLVTYRDLDEALQLTAMATEALTDLRTGDNI